MTTSADAVFDTAMAEADIANGLTPEESQAKREEQAQVKVWLERIKNAREFDRDAFKQMSVDRAYAAGMTRYAVSINLIGSSIDVMKSFLYAKNPDISVSPAPEASMPTMERPVPPVPPVNPMDQMKQALPELRGLAGDAGAMNAAMNDPAVLSIMGPKMAEYQQKMLIFGQQQQQYQVAEQEYKEEMLRRRTARETRKRFSETMQILVSKSWSLADLKTEARRTVAGSLTVALGWLKASWQEDAGLDPISIKKLVSLQDNLTRVECLRRDIIAEKGDTFVVDALQQQLAEERAAIEAAKEAVTSRGMVIDTVQAEDVTVPIGVTCITKIGDIPWLAHRVFMPVEAARVMFPDVKYTPLPVGEEGPEKPDPWSKATRYTQCKPRMRMLLDGDVGAGPAEATNPGQFMMGTDGAAKEMVPEGEGDFVCIHEIQDKEGGVIRVVCEGMPMYLRPPHAPEITLTRFYTLYNMAPVEVDGLRYPQSLVQRSCGLQDEYNSRRTALRDQRRRNKQGIIVDGGVLDKDDTGAIIKSADGEWTVVHGTNNTPLQNAFIPKPTVQLDPALYEVDSIRRDFEEIWGIQQALQGGIQVEKTATEADIQQQGFSARTAFMREPMETMLQDLAFATAETLLQRLTPDDAKMFAGEGAVWPTAAKPSELASMVTVSIKAGSTGKPNTAAERNAWAQTMPIITESIKEIGALRGSSHMEIADKLERVLEITLQLSGSSIDAEEIAPQESSMQPPPTMPGADPAAPPGPGAAPMAPPPDAPMPPTE